MNSFIPSFQSNDSAFKVSWNKLLNWLHRTTLHSSSDILVKQDSHGTTLFLASNKQGGSSKGGINWQSPKELNPNIAVPVNTLVYVSPSSTVCTSGLTDRITLDMATAIPGVWLSTKAVPSVTTSGSAFLYNVPANPTLGTIDTSGGSWRGDLDNANCYWVLVQRTTPCV